MRSKWRPSTTSLIVTLLCALPVRAQEGELITTDTATLTAVFPSSASWSRQKTALLLRGVTDGIAAEIPLGHWDEGSSARPVARDVSAGVSSNGRFAYTFDKAVVWNPPKSKVLKVQTLLRVFGTDGKELWSVVDADAPEGQEPLYFSADGETALILLHKDKAWSASIRYYLGAQIMEAGPFARVEGAAFTRNGRFGMIKWLVTDQSATHTFLDVKTKTRKDIPSGDLYLGAARLDEDGKVHSGKKVVFDFNAPVKAAP